MSELRLGPFKNFGSARCVAISYQERGESVKIEEIHYPCQRKGKQYEAYVIREVQV